MRLALLFLATGCTGNVEFPGTNMPEFFEFQENLGYQWQFANEDVTLTYRMVSEIEDYTIVDGRTEYVMVYRKDCINPNDQTCPDGEIIKSLTMTSDYAGVQIYGVDEQRFDPPVKLANQFMKVGETATTTTGGADYTSTMPEIGDCPVLLPNWTNCAQFDLVSSAGEDAITGSYWAITSFNIVAVTWPGQPGQWKLTNHVSLD